MSARPSVVCGVDGGGTSTRVLVATLDGEVLGEGRSGSGNLHDVGEAVLARHVEEAWRAAWAGAGFHSLQKFKIGGKNGKRIATFVRHDG